MAPSAAATGTRASWWGPTLRDIGEGLLAVLSSALGLGVALLVLDGAGAQSWWDILAAAVLIAIGDRLVRPLLRLLAVALGIVGALVAGLAAQILIAWVALNLVPGLTVRSWGQVLLLLVVASGVMAGARWLVGGNDSGYVLGDVLRTARSRARRRDAPGRDAPGLLIVQLDGVSREVLSHAIDAGLVPTMTRWLRLGTHRLVGWWAQVPATTPASQAGLLHGSSLQVPAFRWWDKDLDRMVVTNRPGDAALVERRLSDGHGLLVHGGAAVSTMFTGDAPTALVVISRAHGRRGFGPGSAFVRFFSSPYVLTRTLGLTLGEMVKEVYQGRQQRARGVAPRVSRRGVYVLLRAISNVLMRDLNTALVAEQLLGGTPTVFVDLVDYDEIAHHAGPVRPEALRALEGIDRVLALLAEVAEHAPRDYRIVVLSDHGQSLGETFEQVEGSPLTDVVRELMAGTARGVDATTEQSDAGEAWSPLNALLSGTGGARLADRTGPARPAGDAHALPEVAVIASGNLGMLWFPRLPGRATLDEITARWPQLVPGLLARATVGVVVVQTSDHGPVALGAKGSRLLADDVPSGPAVQGDDPLAPYGPRARPDLLRVAGLAHTGDVILISAVDDRGSVHAFEGLVGSHGGLGGAQNDAFLLYPASWAIDETLPGEDIGDQALIGAEAVYAQLVHWQRDLGLRP
ncbi:alkaline phosphatase family protein [Pengzhenrongella frigida]|uniref:Phosphodiesterase n=1 Tax=Pengzhenrongella frigida TaxID=1259133 RepID=A0A4Q5N2M8_9MICO|nr:alkaline phosphatase family protein [Cellulomonas sp. HLT2-17]RYV52442.1 phosphodiesterase [Cellulomonas sp. HLT2-17]